MSTQTCRRTSGRVRGRGREDLRSCYKTRLKAADFLKQAIDLFAREERERERHPRKSRGRECPLHGLRDRLGRAAAVDLPFGGGG